MAALGMKSLGGSGELVREGAVVVTMGLRYAMSLPVAVTISGIDSLSASLTIWVASASLFTEPRWYPPIPNAETSRPVRPSGRLGISAPDCPWAARPAVPSINASTKVLRVTSCPVTSNLRGILLCRRERMPAVVCHLEHLSHLDLLHVERKSMSEARLAVCRIGIVKKRNTAIHSLTYEAYRRRLVRRIAEMMSGQSPAPGSCLYGVRIVEEESCLH
jgi:hypothetical protein